MRVVTGVLFHQPNEASQRQSWAMCLISRLNEFELFSVLQSRLIVKRTKCLPWPVVVVSGRNSSLSLRMILLLVNSWLACHVKIYTHCLV